MTQILPFHIILHQPEIPPNTGNIIRLCAATGSILHLIGPLGFRLDAPGVKRAGMDYRELAEVQYHQDWPAFRAAYPTLERIFPCTTKATQSYNAIRYQPGDALLFGSEGSGLPPQRLAEYAANCVRIPMQPQRRSLNLAVSVGIILYEALRQMEFSGLE